MLNTQGPSEEEMKETEEALSEGREVFLSVWAKVSSKEPEVELRIRVTKVHTYRNNLWSIEGHIEADGKRVGVKSYHNTRSPNIGTTDIHWPYEDRQTQRQEERNRQVQMRGGQNGRLHLPL